MANSWPNGLDLGIPALPTLPFPPAMVLGVAWQLGYAHRMMLTFTVVPM